MPGKAAFITGLYVILVPLISAALRQRGHQNSPSKLWIAIGLSVAGMACLIGQERSFAFGIGDAWLLLAALAFAMQIVLIGLLPKDMDARVLVTIQMTVCLLCAAAWVVVGQLAGSVALTVPQPSTLWAVLYLGIVCIAIATVAQTWAQRSVTANETALIFCTEPAWGALAGVLLAGEQFTGLGLLGCALMLLGMAWPELQAVMTRASRAQLLTKGCAKGGK
jgi:drug/metabolite transporter (DMT)-like permease